MPKPARSTRDFSSATTPLDADAVQEIRDYDALHRDYALPDRIADSQAKVADLLEQVGDLEASSAPGIPFTVITYTGRPGANGEVEVQKEGVTKLFQFVAEEGDEDEGNVPVVIASSEDTDYAAFVAKVNSPTWQGAEQLNVLAVQVAGSNLVYLYPADAPGGTPVAGPTDMTVTEGAGLPNATLLREDLDETPGTAIANTRLVPLAVLIGSTEVAATQPIAIPIDLDVAFVQVQVTDANGRRKPFADVRVVPITPVGDQRFVGLYINASVLGDDGVQCTDSLCTLVASTTHWVYFSAGARAKRVLQTELTFKEAVAGGTAVFHATKTTAAGVETALASAVNVATLAAHDPTTLTYDDAPLPEDLAKGDKIAYGLQGGAGLSAPLEGTFTTHWVELVENGDTVQILLGGTS